MNELKWSELTTHQKIIAYILVILCSIGIIIGIIAILIGR